MQAAAAEQASTSVSASSVDASVAATNGAFPDGTHYADGSFKSSDSIISPTASAEANGATTSNRATGSGAYSNGSSADIGNGYKLYNASTSNGNGNGNGDSSKAEAVKPIVPLVVPVVGPVGEVPVAKVVEAESFKYVEPPVAKVVEQIPSKAASKAANSAKGTPYKAPGGRWSKFKTYSVLQVCYGEERRGTGWQECGNAG